MTHPRHLKTIFTQEKLEKNFNLNDFQNIQKRISLELLIAIEEEHKGNIPILERTMNKAKETLSILETIYTKINHSIISRRARINKNEEKTEQKELKEIKYEIKILQSNKRDIEDMKEEIYAYTQEIKVNGHYFLENKKELNVFEKRLEELIRIAESYSPL